MAFPSLVAMKISFVTCYEKTDHCDNNFKIRQKLKNSTIQSKVQTGDHNIFIQYFFVNISTKKGQVCHLKTGNYFLLCLEWSNKLQVQQNFLETIARA